MKKLLLFILICLIASNAYSQELDYGLFFKSHSYKGGERTSLLLENGDFFGLADKFTFSFDLFLRSNEDHFGLVSRIMTNDNQNIDLVFSPSGNNLGNLVLVINEESYPVLNGMPVDQWTPISITLIPKRNKVELFCGSSNKTYLVSLKKSNQIIISMGAYRLKDLQWTDVAPINIKDIKIEKNNNIFRHWELKKHCNDTCFDKVANMPAIAESPIWLINDHVRWKNLYSISGQNIQITYNQKDDIFYIAEDNKKLISFNPSNLENIITIVKSGYLASGYENQLIYDTISNKLISYNWDDEITTSFFSSETQSWSLKSKNNNEPKYWNHSSFYSAKDSTLYMFGGYGYYRYKNDLVLFNPYTNKTIRKNIPKITPRHSSSSTVVGDKLYLYGGRGNKGGKQELTPKSFYDLYSIDLNNFNVEKLWEIPETSGPAHIPTANIIYEPSEKAFYTLITKGGGFLMKIPIDSSNLECMAKPINELLTYSFMYFNIYYSEKAKRIYAVFNKTLIDGTSQLSIYSLNYPAINEIDTLQAPPQNKRASSLLISISLALFLLLAIVLIFIWIKKINHQTNNHTTIDGEDKNFASIGKEDSIISIDTFENKNLYFDRSKRTISLLGVFNVRDKNGIDITSKFSPKLKGLLILLLLFGEKEKRGIMNKEIEELLWNDKDEESARNNRSVSLRKLQVLMEEVGDIEIENNNKFRRIILKDDIFCDYTVALKYIYEAMSENESSPNFNDQLIELLSCGPLLPKTSVEWLDEFKGNYSNLVIDVIEVLLNSTQYKTNDLAKLRLAEIIFMHDNLNETALFIKCSILYSSGKKGLAKNTYDNFCREYLKAMGETYNTSFNGLCN
ncbi:kelch repeat-containing protein [Dysgonomonas sp. HGC4]|uniref:Kelch repeat-containing protein n=1 Tax=Dysgonomonas sp. HGC4 TaxID=1658009 RepID=UPI0006801581|nr:kelch repeat-containing protein [Dysgonomonas sp. HGC4]MBD8347866.1 hypothetical protein [Dysgonomonas sp. HGC4]